MNFKYINQITLKTMTEEEAVEWIKENSGMSFEDTVDAEKIKMQVEIMQILLESYFYEEEEEEPEHCKWCEELDEEYEKHKEDYLFD